jgi:hypothetical protein
MRPPGMVEESKLVISYRITASDEYQAAREHNMTVLDDMVKQLELAPDLKLFGDDQVL